MKSIVVLLLFVSICGQAQDYGKKWSDLNYADDDSIYHTLDVYLPKDSKSIYPVVIYIYGSAWFGNNSKGADMNTVGQALLDAGFAVVTPNHRSSRDAVFPAQINDIKAVIRFIRGNAHELQLDTTFIGISGSSSGGHLASLAGVTNEVKQFRQDAVVIDIEGNIGHFTNQSSRVDAVCSWFGPANLLTMDACESDMEHNAENSPESSLMGYPIQNDKIRTSAASPATYVNAATPPFLLIHGDSDKLVPYCQSVELHEALQKAGAQSEYQQIQGGEHYRGTHTEDTIRWMANFFLAELELKDCGCD